MRALDALKLALEAMKDRRMYGYSWEKKYGHEWDLEEGFVSDVIAELQAVQNLQREVEA